MHIYTCSVAKRGTRRTQRARGGRGGAGDARHLDTDAVRTSAPRRNTPGATRQCFTPSQPCV
jgi:hypothetical protein